MDYLQISEAFLRIIGFGLNKRCSFTRGKHTETNVCQGAADRPTFCNIFLYDNVGVSGMRACRADPSCNLLYCTLIDKVLKPKPVGIPKLKPVIVC